MAMQEKGSWKPLNAKSIVDSVKRVFKTGDISKLTMGAYKHITLHMGFIAHYSIHGFRDEYESPVKFAEMLLTSEYSGNFHYNWRQRDRYVTDRFFVDSYGRAYCESVAEANEGILKAAMDFLGIVEVC